VIDNGRPSERFSFLGRHLPSAFEVRALGLAPGAERAYDESEWRDAIVVVERGSIELECLGGSRRHFATGDVVCLVGLSLRSLRNPGPEPVLLVAVSRRCPNQ
jgi:hypothetical protein